MNTTPTAVAPKYTALDSKNETARSVAGDLLERGLKGNFYSLFIALIQVVDSGLIESTDFVDAFRESFELGASLEGRFHATWPDAYNRAGHLVKQERSFAQEIDFYRQSIFWSNKGIPALIASEQLIVDLVEFYRSVENLLNELDRNDSGCVKRRTNVLPEYTVNPYEGFVG